MTEMQKYKMHQRHKTHLILYCDCHLCRHCSHHNKIVVLESVVLLVLSQNSSELLFSISTTRNLDDLVMKVGIEPLSVHWLWLEQETVLGFADILRMRYMVDGRK